MPPSSLRFSVVLAAVLASLAVFGCDSQGPGADPLSAEVVANSLTAEVVGGEEAGGEYLAGSLLAIAFRNSSSRTLAYDRCSTWLESEAGELESWGAICVVAPQLREIAPGETVVDSFGVSDRARTGRYRYVFRTHTSGYDSLANVTTGLFDVVATL